MRETAIKSLESRFPDLYRKYQSEFRDVVELKDDLMVVVAADRLKEIITYLKKGGRPQFEILMDLFATDYSKYPEEQPERFAVTYNLYSMTSLERLFVRVYLPEAAPMVSSLHDVYKAANWFEREAWDLFGVKFTGHPNLTRILCHHEFEGHPLRKDYPADRYQRLKHAIPSEEL